jgi:predicted SAM-dependent methyltransferase
MPPKCKIDLDEVLSRKTPLVLELGCGNKRVEGRINIDRLDLPNVDIVADLDEGLAFFPDNSVDAIHSKSVLEHVDKLDVLMKEIWRVLKPDGKKHLFVPHFSNPYYYSDYTHQRFFGLYTFEYFSKEETRFTRKVPNFYHDFSFRTDEMKLVFMSPWKTRNKIKRFWGKIFNRSTAMQEFYEENLCYMIPCYGIQATLSPVKDRS